MDDIRNSFLIKSSFDDFEHFTHTVRGWGLEFKQLDCGQFYAHLTQLGGPDLLISKAYFSRKLIQNGNTPKGMRTFVITASGATPFISRKQEMTRDRIFIFPKGADLYAQSLVGFYVITISIAEQIIENAQLSESITTQNHLRKGGALRSKQTLIDGLRYYLEGLLKNEQKNSAFLDSTYYQQEICSSIITQIFDILRYGAEKKERLVFLRHTHLIDQITDWVSEKKGEPCSVASLSQQFQVNERTLRRIFCDRLGVTPHQYLTALRLNEVRKNLLEAEHSLIKVVDIANKWGFWHLGDFARIYKRKFGEYPLETLKRSF
jgi:AraC-like DNA-binding protein